MTSLMDRFIDKLLVMPNGCWDWQAATVGRDYGVMRIGGRRGGNVYAHRIAYELFVGPIPAGLTIDHLCENRRCVNPSHMEPVTARENTLRGGSASAVNARKTHCPQGHPYTNVDNRGGRCCRVCDARRHRQRRERANALLTRTGGLSHER